MPEFLINVKQEGSEEVTEKIDSLKETLDRFASSGELAGKGLKEFKEQLSEILQIADELNNKLDEIIKKKEILK